MINIRQFSYKDVTTTATSQNHPISIPILLQGPALKRLSLNSSNIPPKATLQVFPFIKPNVPLTLLRTLHATFTRSWQQRRPDAAAQHQFTFEQQKARRTVAAGAEWSPALTHILELQRIVQHIVQVLSSEEGHRARPSRARVKSSLQRSCAEE